MIDDYAGRELLTLFDWIVGAIAFGALVGMLQLAMELNDERRRRNTNQRGER